MKFSKKIDNGPVDKMIKFWWRSGSPGYNNCFSGFVTIGRYGKWYQPTALRDAAVVGTGRALAGIVIATITSLRRRPLVEICTVPVLLVCLSCLFVCLSVSNFAQKLPNGLA